MLNLAALITTRSILNISLSSSRQEILELWGQAPLQTSPPHTITTIWKYGDLEIWFEQLESESPIAFFLERSFFDEVVDFRLPGPQGTLFHYAPISMRDCLLELEDLAVPFNQALILDEITEVTIPSSKLKLRFDTAKTLYSIYQESKSWIYHW